VQDADKVGLGPTCVGVAPGADQHHQELEGADQRQGRPRADERAVADAVRQLRCLISLPRLDLARPGAAPGADQYPHQIEPTNQCQREPRADQAMAEAVGQVGTGRDHDPDA
jgi:hypothetical protein